MRIISIILSVIAFTGSLYSYIRTNKAIAKLDDLDTEYKKWETKPTADMPTENTTCVGVAMALVKDESLTCDTCRHSKDEWYGVTCGSCYDNNHYEPTERNE